MISPSITMIIYSYTISEICNLVQKFTYICCGHIRLMVEDTRIPNRAVKWSYPHFLGYCSFARVMLIILTMNLFYKYSMNIHQLQTMLVIILVLATNAIECHKEVTNDYWVSLVQQDMMQNMWLLGQNTLIPSVARSGCFHED